MSVVAAIPQWVLGRHVTAVSIEPLTYDGTTGNLTSTSSTSLVGLCDEISYSGSQTTENIQALQSQYDHEVAIEANDSLTLSEILRSTANSSILAAAWQNANTPVAEYARVVITRGGNTWTFIGLLSAYSETLRKGKSVARLTVMQIDVGNSNAGMTYASP